MFRFDNTYPISAPAVQFVVDDTHKAPVHPVRVLDRAALFTDPNQVPVPIARILEWPCEFMVYASPPGIAQLGRIDLCVYFGERGLVPCLDCHRDLYNNPKHARLLQGWNLYYREAPH